MVMIPAFQAGGPGSIPGRRIVTSQDGDRGSISLAIDLYTGISEYIIAKCIMARI